jgi:signal transduction histidine kinase
VTAADRQIPVVTISLAIAVGVLVLDVYTPQEMPPQYLYVLCILLTIWSPRERTLWWMTAVCIGLTILGAYLSPPHFDFYIILFNRSVAIVLFLATALLVRTYRRTQDQLRLLNRELESRVEDRTHELARLFADREELNRNLHDEVLQSLYAVGLHLESSGRSPQYGRIEPEGPRARALQQLAMVMQKIRSYIGGQSTAEALPFDLALSALVRDMTPASGPQFSVEVEKGLAYCLPTAHVEPLLLIVRETLSNCVRHANARHGTVTARCYNGIMRIEVEDDGVGFDPAATKPGGHGLANMATRAQQLGASYHLEAAPGRGVRVVIELPLEKEAPVGEQRR